MIALCAYRWIAFLGALEVALWAAHSVHGSAKGVYIQANHASSSVGSRMAAASTALSLLPADVTLQSRDDVAVGSARKLLQQDSNAPIDRDMSCLDGHFYTFALTFQSVRMSQFAGQVPLVVIILMTSRHALHIHSAHSLKLESTMKPSEHHDT